MQKLMLRQLSRVAYSTSSQLPKSKALTTTSHAENLAPLSTSSNQAIKAHQQYLSEVHQNLDLNFRQQAEGKTVLAASYPGDGSASILPFLTSSGLGLFSFYQLFAGSYSYYCILGTLGLAGFVAAKYSKLSRDHLKYRSAYLVLLDGNQVEVHTGQTESIVAPISDVRFGTLPSSSGRISNFIQIEGKKYVLSPESKLNRVKIAQIFIKN